MLKLRDFLHLPQLDSLVEQMIAEENGIILLAGIDARPTLRAGSDTFTPSGLSAIFNIFMQEILLAHPMAQAIVVAEERSLARVPRSITRRVRPLHVEGSNTYARQIELAIHERPSLLVIDRLCEATAPGVFAAAEAGLRVLTLMDSVLCGSAIGRQLLELGVQRSRLPALRWIITNQRMAVLCEHCKRQVTPDPALFERLRTRYPHLGPVMEKLRLPDQRTPFYQAGSCEHCHGTGYQGDMAIFDLFRNDPAHPDFFAQLSLLSLEEYGLHLAKQGLLDLNDLLDRESDHLRRTYQLLTASERALTETNAALSRKVFELEATNRVLLQRTEVQMALQDLGQALISSSNLRELAARIARRAGEACGADRVVLYLRLPGEAGQDEAKILSVRGWDETRVGQRVPLREVSDSKAPLKAIRYSQVPPGFTLPPPPPGAERPANPLKVGLRVPLIAEEQIVGVMIVQSTQKEAFTPGETALLQTFANQAALAIQRADLVDQLRAKIAQVEAAQAELVKKERLERELELARQVQQSMLPQWFPQIPGYAFSAKNEPARQVGGDFYDILRLDEDHFGIVIADVADKGLPAALYMALTRSLLLAESRRMLSPQEALTSVNRLLLELGELDGFVSIFYGVVDCRTKQLVYTRAGHERPFLLRDGQLRHLEGTGMVLGTLPEEMLNLSEEQLALAAGDRLVLYTDGLTDVANADGQFSGPERLEDMLRRGIHASADELCRSIFEELSAYRGPADQFDDMTLLVVEVE